MQKLTGCLAIAMFSSVVWACSSGDGKGEHGATDSGVNADSGSADPDAALNDASSMQEDAGSVRPVGCGNKRLEADEECDDGNDRKGDGCDDFCREEPGFSCVVAGGACEECGNGVVESSEECDDGDRKGKDGCSAECRIESGWVCPVANQDCEFCGNGIVEPNERCDEGAAADGVGCAKDCRSIDDHFTCAVPGEACVECGDGKVDGEEVCDDGNTISGDGCVFSCSAVELGFRCDMAGGDCTLCGDGSLDGDEECDDGNFANGDGCSTSCEKEPGAICFMPGVLCSKCGNGFIEFITRNDNGTPSDPTDDFFDISDADAREQCDDGNQSSNDGCSDTCTIEDGGTLPWLCPVPGLSCGRCGDGVRQDIEACDDGVDASSALPVGGDGCSADCTSIDAGYHCPSAGGACVQCGDGVVDAPLETCDDGNQLAGDGCSRACLVETNLPWKCLTAGQRCELCGNGIVESHEVCDDGNRAGGDGCNATCTAIEANFNCAIPGFPCAKCGDGVVSPGEQCDEGQLANPSQATAGCDDKCLVVAPWTCPIPNTSCQLCGDDVIAAAETCEDGNVASGDGCSSTCQIEPGYDCATGTCLASACGDGFRAGNEECDDGNHKSGDGCSFVCKVEDGFSCAGAAGCRRTQCSDGVVEGDEQCDDANLATGDGCDGKCQFEPGYKCPTPGKPCVLATCGDGLVEGYEQCDDKNDAMPGCSATCRLEPGYYCPTAGAACLPTVCGDGLVQGLEECDDAGSAKPGCDANCKVETFFRCKGEPSVCKPIVEFVAIRRFNVSYVNPAALIYDPDRRAFAGHKGPASQDPIELCLDGTILNPNDDTITAPNGAITALPNTYVMAPRPVGNGMTGASYDPFTDHYLFLTHNGATTTLTDIPRDFAPPKLLANYQVDLTGAGNPAEITVGEDGDLYVVDATLESTLVYPRRRDGSLNIIMPNCAVTPDASMNCTSFTKSPDAARSWVAASDDELNAIFTVPGEALVGVFNAYEGAPSYLGTDALTSTSVPSSEYFTFFDPSLAARPPVYGRSALPGLLFKLGNQGRSYSKSGKSAETAADGGAFIICPQNPSEPCQIFARTCSDDAECAGIVPGTSCELTASVPYCHSPGDARDDAFSVDRDSTGVNDPIVLDVLANDSKSESACVDPNLSIVSVCGDGVTQQAEIDHPTQCPNDGLPRGTPVLGGPTKLTYDAPDDGSCGFVDTFTYTADLGGGVLDTATVRVVVACVCGDSIVDSNEQCDQGNKNLPPGTVIDDRGTVDPKDDVYARCGTECFFNVFCGDGYIVFPEECDDRNTANGDGCSAFCTLESVCGDHELAGVEACDDGNTVSGDGCNANCTLPKCGDGNVDIDAVMVETCDDGNLVTGDGCDSKCQVETICGNGITELGEQCDDGGFASGDGCSAICTVENICGNDLAETGEVCDGADHGSCPIVSSQQIECINDGAGAPNLCLCANYCGDSMIGGIEECDAGASGSATCRGSSPASGTPCTSIRCGDGFVTGSEQCDDGNSNPGDGCTNDCKLVTVCGDNKKQGSEQCDDGNNVSGDGCSSACKNENTVCGDGVLDFNEQCDDHNTVNGDGCSSTCLKEGGNCGNDVLDLGEECDDGNTVATDFCDNQCRLVLCGNNVVDLNADEKCDDGNKVSGDGCSATCQFELQ